MRTIRMVTVLSWLALAFLFIPTPVIAGGRRVPSEDPWREVVYDNDGRLLAASGFDGPGTPVSLSTSSASQNDRHVSTTVYHYGQRALSIQRTIEGSTGFDMVYETNGERLVVSFALDDLTGETLVVYRMPDGRVYPLWLAGNGEVLSGDVRGLREALREPMEVTRLLRAFARQKAPFDGELPFAGENLLLPLVTCEDACAEGCNLQCALECAFGLIPCHICNVACAVGCVIGCSS